MEHQHQEHLVFKLDHQIKYLLVIYLSLAEALEAMDDAYAAWEAAESAAEDVTTAAGLRRAVARYRARFSPAYYAGSRMRHWENALFCAIKKQENPKTKEDRGV